MECREFEHLISEYLDGALSAEHAEAFVAHLSSCADCRALLDDVQAALELCRSVGEVEPAPDLDERLRRVLRGAAMSCRAFGELISSYFDGVLTADEYHLFEAHARACARCRRDLEGIAAVTRLLNEVDPVALPEGLNERLLQAVRSAHRDASRSWLRRLRRRWAAWRLGWGAPLRSPLLPRWAMAMVLCAATFGLLVVNLSGGGGRVPVRPAIARLFERAAEMRVEGERVVEHLGQWRAQVSTLLRAFRSDRERSGEALEKERSSP